MQTPILDEVRRPTATEGNGMQLALSPSRAADYKNCPLLYRFRSIDRLPEPPSAVATKGTLVHAVLDEVFNAPANLRSPAAAVALVQPAWQTLCEEKPELEQLFASDTEAAEWLSSAKALVMGYFELEDPQRLEPEAREIFLEVELDDTLKLRGYVDRLDVTPAGEIRVVDYKTGAVPSEAFEAKALFQLKFYALMIWKTRGVVPKQLRLVYLRSKQVLDYAPSEQELLNCERLLRSLARAITAAKQSGKFLPRPGRLCSWCPHQQLCPAHGGTPPPYPYDLV
ncbi:MAG: recombinase RecB [Acidimicrobiales bacterium]|nr:MAG: recombinase RecB [Acidimicrobiales bacterium]